MPDDLERQKAELLAQIERARNKFDGVGGLGRGFVRTADEANDAARYESEVIRRLPDTAPGAQAYLAKAASRWGAAEIAAGEAVKVGSGALVKFTAVASGMTSNVSTSSATYAQIVAWPLRDRQAVEAAEKAFREKTELGQLLDEIKVEMERLRLDVERERRRTPASFLDEAGAAMRVPVTAVGAVTSPLLTLRSAIDRAIEGLIRRRPKQGEVPNRREKILSIGRQCSKPGLPTDHFERLADDDEVVNGKLSGKGKREDMAPAEVVELFTSGAQYLRALLMAVDEARLRDP